jgi:hypothetical protein
MSKSKNLEIHQWTNDEGRVLIVKCVNADMTSYGGFVWPKAGPVTPKTWKRDNECNSGGLFGWAWGMGGDGKDPDACGAWLVFSAKPENVIDLGGKVKVVPGEDGDCASVVYCGTQAGAMAFTMQGRLSFIAKNSRGSASATGYSGSASATGDSGSASATGYRGSASATGYRGSASATGDLGVAVSLFDGSAIEIGKNASGIIHSSDFLWTVHVGAVLIVRWIEGEGDKRTFPFAFLDSAKLKLKEGQVVRVIKGKVQK